MPRSPGEVSSRLASPRFDAHDSDMSTDDDPLLIEHAQKIQRNRLLFAIYSDVYERLLSEVPADRFPKLLEIGSGGGFFKQYAPHVITSDCLPGPGIDRVVDACNLSATLASSSLDAITGFNVFHHLPDVTGFLQSAQTVLRPRGRIVLVEPWFTPVGQWFYRWIHHEPVLLDPDEWRVQGEGRLEGANSRLPTSVFRDRPARLREVVPGLSTLKCAPFHKWLYLLSGGLRLNTRVPPPIARWLVRLDRATPWLDKLTGIFAVIVLERNEEKAVLVVDPG